MRDVMSHWDKWDSTTCLLIHLLVDEILKMSPDFNPTSSSLFIVFLSVVDHIGFREREEDFNWILCA